MNYKRIALFRYTFVQRASACFLNRVLGCVLLTGLVALPSLAFAQATVSGNVTAVEVSGNRRIEADAIKEKMKLKPGTELSAAKVAEDIRAIFALGYFEDVRILREAGVLKVQVKERPVVAKITYEGSEEFETKDLEEATQLKNFMVLNLASVKTGLKNIEKKYEEKGYYVARADYEIKPMPDKLNEVELLVKIVENEQVRIRKIFFLGNTVFAAGELKQFMLTSEGHAFSWASGGGTYREGAFERDLAALAYMYGNEGYIDAKFARPRVSLSQDRRYIDIIIDIDEGKQYFLGNVTFKGEAMLFPESELREAFEMKETEVFSTGKLQEQILKLTDKYGDEGYAFANVIPRTLIREGTQIVDLQIDIEKGEKVHWGKIAITGNSETHDKVIRRELPFYEGELYNATKRKKGLERVRRLGFFGHDGVQFLTSTPKGSTDVLDVEIRVTEKPTGTLNVQAGYGSAAGFTVQGQIAKNNLFGLGQQASFSTTLSSENKVFSISFTDPRAFDSEYSLGGDLYITEAASGSIGESGTIPAYIQRLSGGKIRSGREIMDGVDASLTYKLEHAYMPHIISLNMLTSPSDREGVISSMTFGISYDSRNNRLDPTGGIYTGLTTEIAGLGGRKFQKHEANFRFYKKVFWKLIFRSNFEVGMLEKLTDETVPDIERYIIGGPYSLRGYEPRSVGPYGRKGDTPDGKILLRDITTGVPVDPAQYLPYTLGGTRKIVSNFELEFPLIPEADIRLVGFIDAGNAYDPGLQVPSPFLLVDYGWGIRWYSPLGPLRFEFGFPLVKYRQQQGMVFNFVIAPTF